MVSQGKIAAVASSKAEILKAATALFVEHGLAGLNVRKIAKRAGVSTIGVYSHFSGKTGLLEALYIDGFTQLGDAVSSSWKNDDPRAAMNHAIACYIAFSQTNAAHYSLMFDSGSMAYQPSAAAREAARTAFGKLVATISRIDDLKLDAQKGWALAFELWALVHGFVSLRSHLPATKNGDQIWLTAVHSAVDVHLAGALGTSAGKDL
jgi:AcrR family transcriptional regulator